MISDQDAIQLLHDLVAIPSLSGDEARASRYLASWLSIHGFTASIDESGSVVGTLAGEPPPAGEPMQDIVLLGHIDTVPGHIPIRIENGELWGRGSVDAKGSLATFAAAACGLQIPPGIRLIVIGATEEEAASSRGARLAETRYNPAACIIGEPSGSTAITIGYKGRLLLDARISTTSSHSAGPEPTAAEIGVELWQIARELASRDAPDAPRIFDRIQARLRRFSTTSDGLHDTANLQIGFRLPPGLDPHTLEADLRAAWSAARTGGTHAASDAGSGDTFEFSGHEFAYASDGRSWLAQALTSAIRSGGHRPRLLLKTGTSDMNVVGRSWRCPMLAYGPGDSAMDHTPDERLPIAEYLAAIRTLRDALGNIISQAAGNPALTRAS